MGPRRNRGAKRRAEDIADLATHQAKHVTLDALARYFIVQRKTVAKWINAGVLPGYRYQGVLRVKTADAFAFEQRSRITATS